MGVTTKNGYNHSCPPQFNLIKVSTFFLKTLNGLRLFPLNELLQTINYDTFKSCLKKNKDGILKNSRLWFKISFNHPASRPLDPHIHGHRGQYAYPWWGQICDWSWNRWIKTRNRKRLKIESKKWTCYIF